MIKVRVMKPCLLLIFVFLCASCDIFFASNKLDELDILCPYHPCPYPEYEPKPNESVRFVFGSWTETSSTSLVFNKNYIRYCYDTQASFVYQEDFSLDLINFSRSDDLYNYNFLFKFYNKEGEELFIKKANQSRDFKFLFENKISLIKAFLLDELTKKEIKEISQIKILDSEEKIKNLYYDDGCYSTKPPGLLI